MSFFKKKEYFYRSYCASTRYMSCTGILCPTPLPNKEISKIDVMKILILAYVLEIKPTFFQNYNENIDYILTTPKLPGIPNKAVILEIGVGDTLIEKYKLEYNL